MVSEVQAAERYLRAVKSHLICTPETREYLEQQLQDMLLRFLEENPDASDEEIQAAFGNPGRMAEEMLAEYPEEMHEITHKRLQRSFVMYWALILVTILAVSFAVYMRLTMGGYTQHYTKVYVVVDSLPPEPTEISQGESIE